MKNEDFLSKNQGIILKGIMAIGIILHHLTLQYNNDLIILKPFKYIGFLFVGLFFFISGFGLTISMLTKKDYFSNSKTRILKVLMPFLIAVLVYTLYYIILQDIEGKNIFFIVKYCWFIYEIIGLYILYFLLYKKMNFKKATTVNCTIIIVFSIIIYISGESSIWYKSIFAFIMGIIIGRYKKEFINWINEKYWIKMIILIILLGIFLGMSKYFDFGILEILTYNVGTMLFILICLMFLAKIKDFNNSILKYFGSISFEIYLYHGLVIDLFSRFTLNKNIGVALILIFTFIIASGMKKVNQIVLNHIT